MRLGGPVFQDHLDPEKWISAVKASGYRAAFCPLDADAPDDIVRAYAEAARKADIIIAEVGAWSNPLSSDPIVRQEAFQKCCRQLDLADRIGARCCVNVSGSRGEQWDGHHELNLTEETFDMIVETVHTIIDTVRPIQTFYTLETMPWMYPDSADSYLQLIRAIDREKFAVHFDPTNLINSPERYYSNGTLIREFIEQLGPYIKSVHAKDVLLQPRFLVHIDEVRPGVGNLDYVTLMRCLSTLDPDLPLMMEHLESEDEYRDAAEFIRRIASSVGVAV